MVKKIITVLLFLAAVSFLNGENIISVDMELYNTVMRTREVDYTIPAVPVVGDKYWAYGIAGKGKLSFKSTGNRKVRAELAVDFNYPDVSGVPTLTLQKAYVKAKFPVFRLTVGKTRLGWGDGFVFNSGDVIFGSTSPYVNLTGSEVRTETAWMTAFNFPIGRFSFIEAFFKAPDLFLSGTTPVGFGKIEDSSVGLRLYTKAGGIKIEMGYVLDGSDISAYDINHTSLNIADDISIIALQRPFVSFQGNFGPDWYLNSSVAIPLQDGNNLEAVVKDTFNISLGLFHMVEVGYDSSISFRLESVVLPFLNWREDDGEAGSYAMLLYPEVSFGIGQTVSISVRSIFSPIDLSAQITAGVSWNIFEGFNLLGYGTINAGDGDDTFSWDKTTWIPGTDSVDGVSFMLGVQYIY